MKIGSIYYHAWADDEAKVHMDACILRTIRGRFGYLVVKNEWTWVKTGFGVRATWDWHKRVDPLYRTRFRIADGVPKSYARSKAQALRLALRTAKRDFGTYNDPEIEAEQTREIAALERRLKIETGRTKRGNRPKDRRVRSSGIAAVS